VQPHIFQDLLKHWVLVTSTVRLNLSTVFKSELILMLSVFFKNLRDINSHTI